MQVLPEDQEGGITWRQFGGLDLPHNTVVYATVRALNFAQLETTVGTASLLVDLTPPKCTVLTDGHGEEIEGIGDVVWQMTTNLLTVSLNCADPESGLIQFDYAIGTASSRESVQVCPGPPPLLCTATLYHHSVYS